MTMGIKTPALGRRTFLQVTGGGIAALALGSRGASAAAGPVRWVSPRGTLEVLDDYPYWVAKKFGYFGDVETVIEPGPLEATACVKLVDQNQSDMGFPSPGVFSLGLAQGMKLVSAWEMGAYDVFDLMGKNPLLEIALECERIALEDDYFVKRKLYPNVDFYTGLIYQSMGFPMTMFPVLFAIPRVSGWIAQWQEMLLDPEQKIARPRQIYLGYGERSYVPAEARG